MEYQQFFDLVVEFIEVSFGDSHVVQTLPPKFHPCQLSNEWNCICGVNNPKLHMVYPEFESMMRNIFNGQNIDFLERLSLNMFLVINYDNSVEFPNYRMMQKISTYVYFLHEICEINGYKNIDAGIPMASFLYQIMEKRQKCFTPRMVRDIYYRHRNADCIREKMMEYLLE